MEITLIEQRKVECEYQFTGTDAIIDHPKYGRLFICDGFGGMDELRGGGLSAGNMGWQSSCCLVIRWTYCMPTTPASYSTPGLATTIRDRYCRGPA